LASSREQSQLFLEEKSRKPATCARKKVQISFVRKSQTNKARLSVFEPGTIRHARTISRWVSRRGADRSLDLTVESALLRFFRFFRSSHVAKAIPRVAGDGNAGSARG
jgi:hypothetical protein